MVKNKAILSENSDKDINRKRGRNPHPKRFTADLGGLQPKPKPPKKTNRKPSKKHKKKKETIRKNKL